MGRVLPSLSPRGGLNACWSEPLEPLAAADTVLSFMPPAAERAFAERFTGKLLHGRELTARSYEQARSLYLGLSASLAARVDGRGRTLRQDMISDGTSLWWYHPLSAKDCESDPAFGRILALMVIENQMEALGVQSLTVWGCPEDLRLCLASKRKVSARPGVPRRIGAWLETWPRALAARLAFGVKTCLQLALAPAAKTMKRADVLLSCIWDWSFSVDKDGITDRYYKALPGALVEKGWSVGWLAWSDSLRPPPRHEALILLQSFLSTADVRKSILDLRPLRAYLRRRRDPSFRGFFTWNGFDLFPLFERRLLRGFSDGCIPRNVLISLATERVCSAFKPQALLSFLEHYPFSRAHYAGARRAGGVVSAAVQHASFCRQKLCVLLDPELEFNGKPDGQAVPVPDHVFAMGSAALKAFGECGYPPARVHMTGSPRYDYLRRLDAPSAPGFPLRLMVAPSLYPDVEIDLLEAAAAAAEGLPVTLRLRDHPMARTSAHRRFQPLAERFELSHGSLEDDLRWADIVLFTYSTVGEEAVMANRQAWQWLPLSFNYSALAEICAIPRFGSVSALRRALERAGKAGPSPQEQAHVETEIFFKADGNAAGRIAAVLPGLFRRNLL